MSVVKSLVRNLVTRSTARKTEKQATAWDRYRELLAEINAGQEPDLDEIELVLESLGKSTSDLQADAEIFQQRQEWASHYRQLEPAKAAMAAATAKQQQLFDERSKLLDKLNGQIAELELQIRSHQTQISQAEACGGNLIRTASDPAIQAQEVSLRAHQSVIGDRLRDAQDEAHGADVKVAYFRRSIERLEAKLEKSKHAESYQEALEPRQVREILKELRQLREQLEVAESKQQKAQQDLEPIQNEFRHTQRQLEQLLDAKLIP